jgi:hypothetical protein
VHRYHRLHSIQLHVILHGVHLGVVDVFQERSVRIRQDELSVDQVIDNDAEQEVLDFSSAAGPGIHEELHDNDWDVERESDQSYLINL